MKRAVLPTWALAVLGATAMADELVIGRITYADVKIQSVSADQIGFTFYGRTIHKPLEQVTRVSLSRDPEFNKAEAALAKGRFDEAVAHFTAARQKAKERWHQALIDHRLALAKAGGTRPQPPAATTKAAPKGKTPPGKSDDLLATPEALSALLKAQPPHPSSDTQSWSKLSDIKKRAAETRYRGRVNVWASKVRRFRGRKVAWKLAFQDVAKIELRSRVPVRRPTPALPPGARTPPGGRRTYPRPQVPPLRVPPRTPGPTRTGPKTFPRQGPPEHWRVGYIVKAIWQTGPSAARPGTGSVTVLANVLPTHAKGLDQLKRNQVVTVTGRIRRDLEAGAPAELLYLDAAQVEPTAPPAASAEPPAAGAAPLAPKTPQPPPKTPAPPAAPGRG